VTVFIVYYRMRHSPLLLAPAASRVLVTYVGAALLALLLFVAIMHFLTQRYATLLSLLLLSLVPPMLDELYGKAQVQSTSKRFRYVLSGFCLYFLVNSLFSYGYSQRHVEEGIAWARAELPAG